jgi:hypothetical protein
MSPYINYILYFLLWILFILLKNEFPSWKKLVDKIRFKNYTPTPFELVVLIFHSIGGIVIILLNLSVQVALFGVAV